MRGGEPSRARRGAPAGKAVSHRGRVGWRVYVACRFCRGGFLDREPLRASGLARVRGVPFLSLGSRLTLEMTPRASEPARVRGVPFLSWGISRLTLEMTTCSFGWRADEGVPPYRSRVRYQKRYTATPRLSPENISTTTYFDLKSVAGSGTQSQVSQRLFCILFSPPEKSMNSVSFLSQRRYLLLFSK